MIKRWYSHAKKWLILQYQRTSVAVLIVALLTLTVSFCSYRFQINSNRPEFASVEPAIGLLAQPKPAVFDWLNIGKKSARQGSVTLFLVNQDWKRRYKVGDAPIISIGKNVLPNASVHTEFRVDGELLDLFLACVTYYDESETLYPQAFLFRLGTGKHREPFTPLDELAPPNYEVCKH
jgi:hypothetical protein